jgi:hypothetical protein
VILVKVAAKGIWFTPACGVNAKEDISRFNIEVPIREFRPELGLTAGDFAR